MTWQRNFLNLRRGEYSGKGAKKRERAARGTVLLISDNNEIGPALCISFDDIT